MNTDDEWGWGNEESNNKIENSKVSFINKLRWKIFYKECYKRFGYDASKISILLNNPNIAKYYKNNKEKIHNLLNEYESTVSINSSDLFNVILQSVQRGSIDKVIDRIESHISQIKSIKNDKDYNAKENRLVKFRQKELLEYLKDNLTNLDIENLEKNDDKEKIEQYKGKIEFAKKFRVYMVIKHLK